MPSNDCVIMALDAESYYERALQATYNHSIEDAISYMDMSISLSNDKALYLFYKIKILYLNGLKIDCAHLILSQFHYLYQNCSLEVFLEILDYYQSASECTSLDLATALHTLQIPSVLAYEYINLLENTTYNFHSKALEYKKAGNYLFCIDCCQLSLKFECNSISILHLQAECYLSVEDFQSAIDTFEQILTLYPQTTEITYSLGKAYMATHNFPKAISYLKQFLVTMPYHIEGLTHLGDCYIKSKEYTHAITIYNTLITLESFTPMYYLKLGEIYSFMNHMRTAQKYYRKANELQSQSTIDYSSIPVILPKSLKIVGLTFLIVLLQYGLFKIGILPSIVYDVTITVDQSTIPVNGYTDFEVSYKQFPPYSKLPTYEIVSTDPKIAAPIEGLDSLNGLCIGNCTFEVKFKNEVKAAFDIEVIEKSSKKISSKKH